MLVLWKRFWSHVSFASAQFCDTPLTLLLLNLFLFTLITLHLQVDPQPSLLDFTSSFFDLN
jgi:hypothetical protein